MRYSISTVLKASTLGLVLLAIIALSNSVAKADEVTFAGYTNGCFNCGTAVPSTGGAYQTSSLMGLSFGNSTFSGTSASGFLAFGGNPQVVPGPQNVDNLGSFTLLSTNNVYTGNTFSLRITFTLPPGINSPAGGGSQVFSATLTGTVTSTGNGGVLIAFNTAPILFTFSSGGVTGSFTLAVNNLSINPGQTAEITGTIISAQQTTVPEPASMLLLGTGLIGTAGFARWRIRNRK